MQCEHGGEQMLEAVDRPIAANMQAEAILLQAALHVMHTQLGLQSEVACGISCPLAMLITLVHNWHPAPL